MSKRNLALCKSHPACSQEQGGECAATIGRKHPQPCPKPARWRIDGQKADARFCTEHAANLLWDMPFGETPATPVETEHLRRYYDSGLSITQIGAIVGCHSSTVYRRLFGSGMAFRGRNWSRT